MKPTEALQESLYKELLGRIKQTDLSVPYKEGEHFYYSRTEEGKQYPTLCRKRGSLDAPEQVLLDLNEIGKTEKFVGLGPVAVSDDGNLLAYGLDTTGFRQFVLHVKDLRTGALLPVQVPRVRSIAFAADNRTLFYVVEDPVTKRAHRLYRRALAPAAPTGKSAAAAPAEDPLIHDEKDERFGLHVKRSLSRELILLTAQSLTTTEARFLRADRPEGALTTIAPREADHEYAVDHRGKLLYIRTNSGGRNFRLVTAQVADPRRERWKEIVPHRDQVMLEWAGVFAGHTVLLEREDGLKRLRILDDKDRPLVDAIPLPEQIATVYPAENKDFEAQSFRFHYESPITPRSVYDYDLRKKDLTLKKRDEVIGYDPARYEVQRLHATATDGVKVPISLVYRKGTQPDGKNPALLYAYGSYGLPVDPTFSSTRVSLLDRGVVYAQAHIRGGGDLGKKWHDQGRMMSKRNTFIDFIACAEHLVKLGWTQKERLAIEGGSAGGLLMGAVANMRPDLFKLVIAKVPFVDVMNTMLDESLPLTVEEFEEWGNPKVKEHHDYMMTYSPYDNIARKAYPTMLVKTSYNDSQVMYWEPAKYVARLRAMKTDKNPLLFKINMGPAGHGGFSGRYDRLRDVAFDQAFILTQLGAAR
jgi:oligopeptidase B